MKAVHGLIKELAVYENEPDAVEISIEDLERDGFSDVPKFKVFLAEVENALDDYFGDYDFEDKFSQWINNKDFSATITIND